MSRVVRKKAQTYNHEFESKQNWNSVFHEPRQMPIDREAVEPWD